MIEKVVPELLAPVELPCWNSGSGLSPLGVWASRVSWFEELDIHIAVATM